jgi:Transposase DDE domain
MFVKRLKKVALLRQKRSLSGGKTKRGKGNRILGIADASRFPVTAHVEGASPHELKVGEADIERDFTICIPDNIIGDKTYANDKPDKKLCEERGIELITPYCIGRKKPRIQDGRKLGRYACRWKVEQLFAGLKIFRELLFDMNIMWKIIFICFNLVALKY